MNDYNNLVRKILFRVSGEEILKSLYSLYSDYNISINVHDVLFNGMSTLNMCASDIMDGNHGTMKVCYQISYSEGDKCGHYCESYQIFSLNIIRNRLSVVRDEVRLLHRAEILNNITNE